MISIKKEYNTVVTPYELPNSQIVYESRSSTNRYSVYFIGIKIYTNSYTEIINAVINNNNGSKGIGFKKIDDGTK